MRFFESLKKSATSYFKIFTLWDVMKIFSKTQYLKMVITFILNIFNSATKIVAPAALARAIEIYATDNQELNDESQLLEARYLLLSFILLSVWTKADTLIKSFLLNDLEENIIETHCDKIITVSHEIPIDQHVSFRSETTNLLMEIMNSHSKLPFEVLTGIYQVLIDITLGSSLIWYRYGNLIGSEFLTYCLVDLLLIRNLSAYFMNQEFYFKKMNDKLFKYINNEYEIMNCEETVRMFNHEELEKEFSNNILKEYFLVRGRYLIMENISHVIRLIPFVLANLIPVSFILKDKMEISDLDDFIFLLSYINIFGSNLIGLNNSIKTCLRAVNSIENMEKIINDVKLHCHEIYPEPSGWENKRESNEQLEWIQRGEKSTHNSPERSQATIVQAFRGGQQALTDINYPSPEISFEEVTFTYPKNSQPTLKRITFKVPPGKKIGIIGRSSAGKSTILTLLYGIYRPQLGAIKINGVNINSIPHAVLCKIFCCVPQNLTLFKDHSLKYNVLYGSRSNHLLKKYASLKLDKRKQEESAEHSPEGYDTFENQENREITASPIYKKTLTIFSEAMNKVDMQNLVNRSADSKSSLIALSGGQKQRVGIARALVRNSSIFLLDEATKGLDSSTECKVLNNIKEVTAGKSCIMITHHLSTIQDADEVIVLEAGSIVEKGSPSELLEKKGIYYEYYQAQLTRV